MNRDKGVEYPRVLMRIRQWTVRICLFALFSFGTLFFRLSTVYFIRLRILFDPNDLNSKIELKILQQERMIYPKIEKRFTQFTVNNKYFYF